MNQPPSPPADYGTGIDRWRAAAHATAALVLLVWLVGAYPVPTRLATTTYLLSKAYLIVAPDRARTHQATMLLTLPFGAMSTADQLAVGRWPIAMFVALVVVDNFAYHLTALRRIAFFDTQRRLAGAAR